MNTTGFVPAVPQGLADHVGVVTLLGVLLGVLPAAPSAAQVPDTLRLDDAITLARQGNPQLQASRLMADAAAERIGPAPCSPSG